MKNPNRSFLAILCSFFFLCAGMTAVAQKVQDPLEKKQDKIKTGETANLSSGLPTVVTDNNRFALDMYGRLRGQDGNLFFSPANLSLCLAMAYAGAHGETARQMAATLHFSLDQQQLHQAFAPLTRQLTNEGNPPAGYQLSIAAALWGQKGYGFLESFTKTVGENYGARLNEVDFAVAPERARQTINAWVDKETQGKIKELITSGVLGPNTRLVLTSAVYFKGNWASRFQPSSTRQAPFMVTSEQKVAVSMMHQSGKFKTMGTADFRALELPYVGKDLSMIVFLPSKVDGLAQFERTLTAEKLDEWLSQFEERSFVVELPKFRVSAKFELAQTLSAMGMPLAFSDGADFSGMTTREGLKISEVLHKAFVDVNEEGTEAAAATGLGVVRALGREVPLDFLADHPFMFLIRDNRTGSILFMGCVKNPQV